MEKAYGSQHPEIVGSLDRLVDFYESIKGREAEAEPFLKRALAIAEKTSGPEHPDIVYRLDTLADFYKSIKRREAEAELLLKRRYYEAVRPSPAHRYFRPRDRAFDCVVGSQTLATFGRESSV